MSDANTGSLGFDKEIAIIAGVEAAVLYQNISFWVETNKANNRNFYEDKYWTYNSARAFSELFPFWSSSKIVRLLIKLEKMNLIESGEFNQRGYDRTKWYTTICRNRKMDLPESVNGVAEIGKAIPDINTDINTVSIQKEETKEIKYTTDDIKLTDALYHTVAKLFPNYTKLVNRKPTEKEYMDMNRLHRIDGNDYQLIQDVMRWLYTGYKPLNEFDWKDQIKSVKKLRQHFDTLRMQFEKDKKSGRFGAKITYDTRPPEQRKSTIAPSERERVVSTEDAEKNKIILQLVKQKKATFSEHKKLKSKTIDQLRDMLNSV